MEHVKQLACPAGSAVIFTESLTHGALPWVAAHQRRSLLVRYCPGHMAMAGPDWKWPDADWPAAYIEVSPDEHC